MWGSKQSLTLLGWWVPCFLVLACVYCPGSGVVGVGACFGLGIKRFSAAVCGGGKRAHCRVHVQHRVSVRRPCGGGCPHNQPEGFLLLGVGCVWWVVCDLYSGCEHICSVLFFVFCLVLLGIRWMPWHQELMKDVAACDMPRGAGERALLSEGVRMGEPNLGCAGLPSSERV